MHTRKVKAYPESKCLNGEHKHPESTCWGLEFFFIMQNKSICLPGSKCLPEEYPPTRKVNAYTASTSTRESHAGAWNFLSCKIRVYAYRKVNALVSNVPPALIHSNRSANRAINHRHRSVSRMIQRRHQIFIAKNIKFAHF